MRRLDIPFDRGVNEAVDTQGTGQTADLAACVNLWSRNAGTLSPRPGLDQLSLPDLSLPQFLGRAGNVNLAILGGTAYTETKVSPNTKGATRSWDDAGKVSRVTPWDAYDVHPETDGDEDIQEEFHEAVAWGNRIIETYSIDETITPGTRAAYIRVLDRETRQVLSSQKVADSGVLFGISTHSAAIPPKIWSRVSSLYDEEVTLFEMTADRSGYDTGTVVSLTIAVGNAMRAVGHADGGTHLISNFGAVYIASDQTVTGILDEALPWNNTLTITRVISAIRLSGSECAFSFFDSGDLVTIRLSSSAELNRVTIDADGDECMTVAKAGGVSVFTQEAVSGTPGMVTRHDITWGAGSTSADWHNNLVPIGGQDGTRAWFLNHQDKTATRKYVLIDTATNDAIVEAFSPRVPFIGTGYLGKNLFGSALPASGEAETSAATPARSFVLLRCRIDPANDLLSRGVGHEYATDQTLNAISVNGEALAIGGETRQLYGGEFGPVLLPSPPIIEVSMSGSSGDYQYVATWSYVDPSGVRHETGPGNVITTTSEATAVISLNTPGTGARLTLDDLDSPWRLRLYRTTNGGTLFYDAVEQIDGWSSTLPPVPGAAVAPHMLSDSEIQTREAFYIDAGEAPNDAPPSATFGAVGLLRVFLAGLFRPYRVQFSKETLRGEAPAFPDLSAFWIDFPSRVTGLAAMDDAVIVFEQTRISIISGSGPDNRGVGGFSVREIATGIGCSDWRSVVTAPQGTFFAGNGTIWLLPRGFGVPLNVGANYSRTLQTHRVIGATFAEYDDTQAIQFLIESADGSASKRLVYVISRGAWFEWGTDSNIDPRVIGTFSTGDDPQPGQRLRVVLADDGGARVEDIALAADDIADFTCAIETHDLHPWGLAVDAQVTRALLRCSPAAGIDQPVWDVTASLNGGFQTDTLAAVTPLFPSGWTNLEFRMPNQRFGSVALRFVTGPISAGGVTLEFNDEGIAKPATAQSFG